MQLILNFGTVACACPPYKSARLPPKLALLVSGILVCSLSQAHATAQQNEKRKSKAEQRGAVR